MREALPPVSALERINDLTTRIADGVLRWHRGLDDSLSAWDDGEQVRLLRSRRGRVRLTLTHDNTRIRLESSDANLTGALVALWGLADSHADRPDR
jgi:hypothetical protein